MKGTIKIKINSKNHRVKITGHMVNPELPGQAAIIDSLMNSFEINGELREAVCSALVDIDAKRLQEEEAKAE